MTKSETPPAITVPAPTPTLLAESDRRAPAPTAPLARTMLAEGQHGNALRGHPAILLAQAGRSAAGMVLGMGGPRLVKNIYVNKKGPVL